MKVSGVWKTQLFSLSQRKGKKLRELNKLLPLEEKRSIKKSLEKYNVLQNVQIKEYVSQVSAPNCNLMSTLKSH